MSPRRRLASALLAATIATYSAMGFAQTSEAQTAAAQAYHRGMAALGAGHHQTASVEFETSYRMNPVPDVLFNLALAYRGAGRLASALGAFERYLATAPRGAPPQRIAAIRVLLPSLESSVARIDLGALSDEARVSVDDVEISLGDGGSRIGAFASGTRQLRVDPGSHEVLIEQGGRAARRERLVLARGQLATLEPPPPALRAAPPPDEFPARATASFSPTALSRSSSAQEAPPSRSVATRWWFWTLIGAAVIGAAVATVVLTREPEPPSPGVDAAFTAIRFQ